ncbi:PP2C family protein-serine/threonine phosphatase [Mycobacterium sp.]|uniref:PP2C family protein-serine/threonine phosphatase n=1 Tax=Mycobacterium sp. TaxID=1785 RepID=UPI002C6FF69D|nr:protein phosphatase 2C domain-containing protein [Mycobacterium sp.]HXB85894.1 protein phosphatase 2C domain-containing protein [Mycobacterium sp.]
MTLVLRYAARSDVGLVRSNNEDSVYAGARLLALADGMGGHAAGEVASQLVVAALAHLDDDEPGGDLLAKLDTAIRSGNSAIAAQVEMEPDLEGMGTTLTAILFAGNRLGLAHIGDSRGYLLRDGELTQITKDDTFVQTLVDEGRITREEAHSHPQRSLIMRALTGHEVEPTLTMREVHTGDRYLLCSDGLSDPVSDETILDALQIPDVTDSADRLIELALRGGGPDNVTVVVADVVDYDYGPTQPIIAGAVSGEDDQLTLTRPNTAAGRASAISPRKNVVKRVLPQVDTFTPPRRSRRRIAIGAALIVLLVLATLAIGRTIVRNYYYVADYGGAVSIMQGIQVSILGVPLHQPYSQGCLNSRNQLSVIRYGQAGGNCQPMKLADLAQSARAQVAAGLPVGTLEQADAQLRRLSTESLLPLCPPARAQSPPASTPQPAAPTTTQAPESSVGTPDQPGASPSPTSAAPTVTALAPPPPQPGTDCRAPT